jgi:hypothetical protein
MKIDISKAYKEPKALNCSLDLEDANITFDGTYKKEGQFLVVEGTVKGKAKVICDMSGDKFFDQIDEQIAVKFITGIYEGFDEKYDIIEIDNDYLDFDSFLNDEIESFKLGFHRKQEYKTDTQD